MNRVQDLEQQLAHLRWRRMQNERKIRNGINTTRSMKEKDTILNLSIDHAGERATWMTRVVRDELMRPMVLSDEEMNRLQADELRVKDKYRKNVSRSEHTLMKLKKTITKGLKNNNNLGGSIRANKLQKLQKIENIEKKLNNRKQEIDAQVPIVHAKWSRHNDDVVNQQRMRRFEMASNSNSLV